MYSMFRHALKVALWGTVAVWLIGLAFTLGWLAKTEVTGEPQRRMTQRWLAVREAAGQLSEANAALSLQLEDAKMGLLYRDFFYR